MNTKFLSIKHFFYLYIEQFKKKASIVTAFLIVNWFGFLLFFLFSFLFLFNFNFVQFFILTMYSSPKTPKNPNRKKTNNELTNEKKRELLEKQQAGASYRNLAADFGISLGTVSNIVKRRKSLENTGDLNEPANKKRNLRKTPNVDINNLIWIFFLQLRSKSIPVTGPLLRTKAKRIADSLGIAEFEASDGWLTSFKKRHNILFKTISGEAKSVNTTVTDDWKHRLQFIVAKYQPQDIFNADETGLFWRALPNKTLAVSSSDCHGTKNSKERLTVLFCVNFAGEKLKPLVIGKSENPRCFKSIKKVDLPVIYRSNKKA